MEQRRDRLIVVSNRLPFVCSRDAEGKRRIQPGSGGLVSALVPVLRQRGGPWTGWLGACETSEAIDQAAVEASAQYGFSLRLVKLSAEEVRDFYQGSRGREQHPDRCPPLDAPAFDAWPERACVPARIRRCTLAGLHGGNGDQLEVDRVCRNCGDRI